MATARVFQSGNSQAVRLPKEFRLRGKEVEISRRGDEVVLRERPENLGDVMEILHRIREDVFEGIRDDRPPQEREGP
jgi:antitoxin VapB